jgi:hypothetical protein
MWRGARKCSAANFVFTRLKQLKLNYSRILTFAGGSTTAYPKKKAKTEGRKPTPYDTQKLGSQSKEWGRTLNLRKFTVKSCKW